MYKYQQLWKISFVCIIRKADDDDDDVHVCSHKTFQQSKCGWIKLKENEASVSMVTSAPFPS